MNPQDNHSRSNSSDLLEDQLVDARPGAQLVDARPEAQDAQSAQNVKDSEDPDTRQFFSFLRTALVPMLITKSLILFFGINYSNYPGEGYGWGLVLTLIFSALSFGYFIWSQSKTESD